tara:strand:- start:1006 stop:1695 length:690 start_codon:yes stop_codon:yes gene_type:complete
MAKEGIWIPMHILELTNLSLVERYILADITHFHDNNRVYFKTNSTLAEECKSSRATITRAISNLVEIGLIKIQQSSPVRKLEPTHSDEPPTHSDEPPTHTATPPTHSEQPPTHSDAHKSKVKSKVKNKIKSQIKIEVVSPFLEKEFLETWEIWKEERISNGSKKYTPRGEQGALHTIQKFSKNDYKTAIEIINQSIVNGWRGLFELKKSKQNSPELDLEKTLAWAYGKR